MDNRLFLVSNGSAVEMSERRYDTEDFLQKLVEDNPHLLARAWGEQGCRLFLIQRELEVTESDDSSNSYSLDHLLVGEDAVPVLVEVKRSTDTRIRREVVAQMLDYACRASRWDVGMLRSLFAENNDVEDARELDTDEFWDQVATNLRAERLRLVFVADKIPDTLRVMIEFLDRSMSNIEVYGVELRPYTTSDALLLSSSVIGNSLLEKQSSAPRTFRTWDDDGFREYLKQHDEDDLIPIVFGLKDFAIQNGLTCSYGKGAYCPSFAIRSGRQDICIISGWWKKSMGHVCTAEFGIHRLLDILDDSWNEDRLRSALSDMPEAILSKKWIWDTPKYQYIDLRALLDSSNVEHFKSSLKMLGEALKTV